MADQSVGRSVDPSIKLITSVVGILECWSNSSLVNWHLTLIQRSFDSYFPLCKDDNEINLHFWVDALLQSM